MKRFPFLSALVCVSVLAISFTVASHVKPDLYFTKRNVISFKITAENGAISYSTIEINNVIAKTGQTDIYADDKRSDDQHKSTFTYRMKFHHDSLNWCEDALNHLKCDAVYSSNKWMIFKTDSLVFPYAIKVGDTLPPAFASETQRYENTENVRKIEFRGRKVAGMDSIPYNSRKVLAYRIECKTTLTTIADYGPLGKIPTELKYDFTQWFAPELGVIKTRSKTATGESTRVMLFTK